MIGAEVQDLDILKGCEDEDKAIGIIHLHFENLWYDEKGNIPEIRY